MVWSSSMSVQDLNPRLQTPFKRVAGPQPIPILSCVHRRIVLAEGSHSTPSQLQLHSTGATSPPSDFQPRPQELFPDLPEFGDQEELPPLCSSNPMFSEGELIPRWLQAPNLPPIFLTLSLIEALPRRFTYTETRFRLRTRQRRVR